MKKKPDDNDRILAISNALMAFLNEEQTANALQLWQEKYAGNEKFSVQYFARDCCLLLGIEGRRSDLIKNLVRELYIQLHTLDHIQFDKNP